VTCNTSKIKRPLAVTSMHKVEGGEAGVRSHAREIECMQKKTQRMQKRPKMELNPQPTKHGSGNPLRMRMYAKENTRYAKENTHTLMQKKTHIH
jgi:hypothetical protein